MKATVSIAKGRKRKPAAPARANQHADVRPERRLLYIAVGLLTLVVFACFLNSLGNGFVFDDKPLILENSMLRSLANLPRLVTASYRPLRDITHAFDFALWGEKALGFHLTNIFIHLGNTLLVLALIRRVSRSLPVAFIAALVFAVHPVQTDAVTYISGRRDILFAFFYLLSFYWYLNYRERGRWRDFGLFLGCWVLSLMSKEMAASLPAFIFVWNFCAEWGDQAGVWPRRAWRTARAAFWRDRWLYLALVVAVLAYVYYQTFVKGGSVLARDGFKYWGGSFYTNLLLIFRVQAWNLKQLVWPTPMVQYKGAFEIITTALDWRVLGSFFVVATTFVSGLLLLNRHRLLAFAVLSYFVLLLPVSQIIPHHELLADHYLYLSMMSFGLLIGLLVERVAAQSQRTRQMAYTALALAIVALGATTVLRNRVWKDDLTLWQTNYREAPNSIRAVSSLAKAYSTINPGRSEELYKRCLEIDPTYWPAYYSLALIDRSRDKAREAEGLIRAGLNISDEVIRKSMWTNEPSMFRSQMTAALAQTRLNQGDTEGAEQLYHEAIGINALNPQPYTMLANLYREREPAKAIVVLQQLVAAYPGHREPLEQVASLLIEEKRDDEAIGYLNQLLDLMPHDYTANLQLSRAYRGKKDCGRAGNALAAARAVAFSAQEKREIQAATDELNQDCGR